MIYAYRILSVLIIGMSMLMCAQMIKKSEQSNHERIETMSNQSQSKWLDVINASKNVGAFTAKDKFSSPVIIEWKILGTTSPDFAPTMRSIADLATHAFTSVELQFLQQHPQAMTTEGLYQDNLAEFQNQGTQFDWQGIENKIASIISNLYTTMDWSKFGGDDRYIFAMIKDEKGGLLGFITFFVRPSYAYGDCKVTAMGIMPAAQNRGLGKLLMSSIFEIIRQIQRIFLSTRVTNVKAIAAYRSWGFVIDKNPMQEPGHTFNPDYWIFMEYRTEQTKILQEAARTLVK